MEPEHRHRAEDAQLVRAQEGKPVGDLGRQRSGAAPSGSTAIRNRRLSGMSPVEPEWAENKIRKIAHGKGWDYHALRSN